MRCGYDDYDFSETLDTQTVEDFELLAVIKTVNVVTKHFLTKPKRSLVRITQSEECEPWNVKYE